jgi:predicted porin
MRLSSTLMATTMLATTVACTSAASADEISKLQLEASTLKEQNNALEKRLNKLEKQQAAQPAAPAPTSADYMAQAGGAVASLAAGDGPLTFHGITLFGTVDAGLGWFSHGLTQSPYLYAMPAIINKNANHSYFGMVPNGLSQTSVGIKGTEELLPGLSGVFMASTGINPQSGQLASGAASLMAINGTIGRPTINNGDASRAGQAFNDQLYVGLSSKDFGQLTFGRHRSFAIEMAGAYDPAGGSYSLSYIGYTGTPLAGFGATEDARWDDSLKYRVEYGPVHFGAMYKFVNGNGGSNVGNAYTGATTYVVNYATHNDAYQFNLGGKYGGFEADAVFGQFHQATQLSPLSAAQLAGASTFTNNFGAAQTTLGNNNGNTLVGTISDTTGAAIGAKYTWNQWKFFAGYSHVLYQNPTNSVGIGASANQGGVIMSTVNNHPYANNPKTLQTFWTGFTYAYDAKTIIGFAYNHALQNTYTTVANTPSCSNPQQSLRNSACSGNLDTVSLYVDYHFTKRFDIYAGMMVSNVSNGLASGYAYPTNFAPLAGARYTF